MSGPYHSTSKALVSVRLLPSCRTSSTGESRKARRVKDGGISQAEADGVVLMEGFSREYGSVPVPREIWTLRGITTTETSH